MSCNHCTTKFNFFHKEIGCSNCGLSFCNKCVKQKCKIPNKGNNEFNVCKTCYLKLSAGSSSSTSFDIAPPEAYLKRLEALDNPVAPPITMYKNDQKLINLRSGLSPVDLQLLERLEKLKEDGKIAPPSEVELRKRLATLKGENNYTEGPSKQVFAKDLRSDQEKSDSLLEQFMKERDIELAQNPQEEIEARLASLRVAGVRPNEGPYISNLHDSSSSSEEDVDKITKKIMDEVALEERCRPPLSMQHTNDVAMEEDRSTPELPWCVLCNNDASFRCLDCGGDLYCAECNREVHKNWGDTDHKVIPFKPK